MHIYSCVDIYREFHEEPLILKINNSKTVIDRIMKSVLCLLRQPGKSDAGTTKFTEMEHHKLAF